MNFCPGCGSALKREVEAAEEHASQGTVEAVTDSAVEIARIEADRDIKIAKIGAGVAEAEAVIDAAHAEGVAEGMETASAPDIPAEPAPTVIVDAPTEVEAGPEPSELDLPPADGTAPSEPHEEPKPKSRGYGNGAWFGGR